MPALFDTRARAQVVAEAVNQILVLDGAEGVSLRAIARVSGIPTSSLLHHLSSRARILGLSASLTARAHLTELASRRLMDGVEAHLPADGEDLTSVARWHAWTELARYESTVATSIGAWHTEERSMLWPEVVARGVASGPATETALDMVFAHVCGLRVAMIRPQRPLSLAEARRSLHAVRERAFVANVDLL
jgi:AcrR family transcriptional regulator